MFIRLVRRNRALDAFRPMYVRPASEDGNADTLRQIGAAVAGNTSNG